MAPGCLEERAAASAIARAACPPLEPGLELSSEASKLECVCAFFKCFKNQICGVIYMCVFIKPLSDEIQQQIVCYDECRDILKHLP